MADRTFLGRVWPSLVALVGTVAVVVALLVVFGDRVGESGEDPAAGDVVDDAGAEPTAAPDQTDAAPDETAGGDNGTDDGNGADGEPTDEPEPDRSPVTADPDDREPVGVLNATGVAGLAGDVQELFGDGGWEVPAIDTSSRDLDTTTVFYPDGMEDAARALQDQFPDIIAEVSPTEEGLNDNHLVVILGSDYAESASADE